MRLSSVVARACPQPSTFRLLCLKCSARFTPSEENLKGSRSLGCRRKRVQIRSNRIFVRKTDIQPPTGKTLERFFIQIDTRLTSTVVCVLRIGNTSNAVRNSDNAPLQRSFAHPSLRRQGVGRSAHTVMRIYRCSRDTIGPRRRRCELVAVQLSGTDSAGQGPGCTQPIGRTPMRLEGAVVTKLRTPQSPNNPFSFPPKLLSASMGLPS